ncbi:hypothetical protein [Moorena sp. SIO3H5]|nr:hypothetical protein [Moorena sp. SIO3H5]
MQRGLGGFPHERLHQDGSREQVRVNSEVETGKKLCGCCLLIE